MRVSAEAREEWLGIVQLSMNRSKSLEEVKAFDGASRTVGLSVLMSEDERRAPGAVDDARGENAEDAAMPVRIVEDETFRGCGKGCELSLDGLERLCFGRATFVVQAVQFFGQIGGAGGVFGEKQLDYIARDVHSASG